MEIEIINAIVMLVERVGLPTLVVIIAMLMLVLAIRAVPALLENQRQQIAANVAATEALKSTATAQLESATAIRETMNAMKAAHQEVVQGVAANTSAAQTAASQISAMQKATVELSQQQAETFEKITREIRQLHADVQSALAQTSAASAEQYKTLLQRIETVINAIESHAAKFAEMCRQAKPVSVEVQP